MHLPLALDVGSSTHPGKVRSINEDSLLIEPLDGQDVARWGLFLVVADGMGGHEAGEVASELAVRTARDAYYASGATEPPSRLDAAMQAANARVYQTALDSGRLGMGTTMTSAVILGQRLLLGQVGDSRAYLIRGETVTQLTSDHSWVQQQVDAGMLTPEQARTHPNRNVITRAIGQDPEVEVDLREDRSALQVDDWLLLCSDGFHTLVREQELPRLLAGSGAQQAAKRLVDLAVARGAPDNVTVVLVHVQAPAVVKSRLNRDGPLGRRILANFPGLV